MSNISYSSYCNNPQLYKNALTTNQLNFYNEMCQSVNGMNNFSKDIENELSNLWGDAETIGSKAWGKLGPEIDKLAQNIGPMIESFFTPEGIKLLSYFTGISITGKIVANAFKTYLKDSIEGNISKLSEYILKNGIKMENSCFNFTAATKGMIESVDKQLGKGAFKILNVFSPLAEFLSGIDGVLDGFMLLSMVIDSWDPCDLNDQLGGNALNIFTKNFNESFRKTTIKNYESIPLGDGTYVYNDIWPLEYIDSSLIDDLLTDQEKKYYNELETNYYFEYLLNLTRNSDGYPIKWKPDIPIINSSQLNNIEKFTSNKLSNNNTIIANLIYKILPLLILLLIFIIILIFVLIK